MNKVFFRYIAGSFWGPFFFGLGAFVCLLLFGNMFDKLNYFIKSSAGFPVFLEYLLCQVPYFVVRMTPMATLLAVLFALGGMIGKGEWKAGMAGGWRPFDMVLPLLACAAAAAAMQFLVQETAAPYFYMRSEFVFEGKIWGRADWKRLARRDVSFSAGPDVFVTAKLFDGASETMEKVLVSGYDGGKMAFEINAGAAAWDKAAGSWVFTDGVLVKYGGPGRRPVTSPFKTLSGRLRAPPDALVLERLVPDGVSMADIAGRIRRLEAVGAPVIEEEVQFYSKLAGPLANLVLALTGLMLVLLIRMNRFLGFGVALGVGFFFWVLATMGQYAGEAEMLPPAAAGFGPAALFLTAALFGLRRARVF